ncbi:hypothetical protein BDV19DRAFT_361364 [Aspergillus venezuelensis]
MQLVDLSPGHVTRRSIENYLESTRCFTLYSRNFAIPRLQSSVIMQRLDVAMLTGIESSRKPPKAIYAPSSPSLSHHHLTKQAISRTQLKQQSNHHNNSLL